MRKATRRILALGKATRLTCGLSNHEHPAISPAGEYIAYYFGEYGSLMIAVVDRRGRLARVLSPTGGNSTQPAWSPEGRRLAYRHQASSESKWEIWESSLVESDPPRQILADPQWHYKHPIYHPVGRLMAYFSDEGSPGVFHIWQLDLESKEKRQLTFGSAQNHCHPVYSPDGTRIAFHAYEGTDESKVPAITNLFELDLASNEIRQLTSGGDQYKHPFYLNSHIISFHHEDNRTGYRCLCLMDLHTLQVTNLTTGAQNDKHPYPYRDEKGKMWIAYASEKRGPEQQIDPNSYDIFLARLISKKQKSKSSNEITSGVPFASVGARSYDELSSSKQYRSIRDKFKSDKSICKNCAYPMVQKGVITDWRQTKEYGKRGKSQACKKCPARMILDREVSKGAGPVSQKKQR